MEWISVKDRLPGDEQDVLTWIGHRVRIDYCGTTDRRFGWDSATHWMPIPEPPEDTNQCDCAKCDLKRKGLWS